MNGCAHFVHFFAGADSLTWAAAGFVQRGLETNEVCLAIATPARQAAIEATLRNSGLDPAALIAGYDYIPIDADAMLHEFLRGDRIDRERFFERAILLLRQAASKGKPVRIFGEMVGLLAERRLYAAVIEVEEMCNELGRMHDFNMFCGYCLPVLGMPPNELLLRRISALHSHSMIASGAMENVRISTNTSLTSPRQAEGPKQRITLFVPPLQKPPSDRSRPDGEE
jgi:hypothetical protein